MHVVLCVIYIQKYMREISGINREDYCINFQMNNSKSELYFGFNILLSIMIAYS